MKQKNYGFIKTLIGIFFLFTIIYLLPAQNNDVSRLIGTWTSESELGTFYLVFYSENELEFDGEYASYTLKPGIIAITDEYGVADYPYSLQNNTLIISFPEGYQLQFQCVGQDQSSTSDSETETMSQSPVPATLPDQSISAEAEPASLSGDEVGNPQWGFTFHPPAGWKYKQSEQGILLGHDQIAGMIIVFPHTYSNMQALQQAMREGLQEKGIVMYPAGQPQTARQNSITGEYQGTWQGVQARGKGIGTLSPHGGGAIIIAVTTPEKYSRQLVDPAEQIAKNMRYFQVDANDMIRHFAGHWWYYSGTSSISHEKLMQLAPDGTYRGKQEDAADVSNFDQYGNVNNQYLGNYQDRSSGRWTVRGNKYEGIIIVTRADGSTFDIEYRVKPASPQKFGSYYFNGTLYNYVTEEQLQMMNY